MNYPNVVNLLLQMRSDLQDSRIQFSDNKKLKLKSVKKTSKRTPLPKVSIVGVVVVEGGGGWWWTGGGGGGWRSHHCFDFVCCCPQPQSNWSDIDDQPSDLGDDELNSLVGGLSAPPCQGQGREMPSLSPVEGGLPSPVHLHFDSGVDDLQQFTFGSSLGSNSTW